MKKQLKEDLNTEDVDNLIQPYYQKAQLDYLKEKNKKHIAWDFWFLVLAIVMIIYSILFD
jgi:hypothetical protein